MEKTVRSGETQKHRELKFLARSWLKERHHCIVATETRIPLSNYRVDVAGYQPMAKYSAEPGYTFIVECKQSRADFQKDAGREDSTSQESHHLLKRIASLKSLLAIHLPDCRLHQSLFREYDAYDFSNFRHDTWHALLSRLQQVERRLSHGVKFSKISRYGCANFCFLAVEAKVVKSEKELPLGWGLLERAGDGLEIKQEPLLMHSAPKVRLKFLERISARNARK